MSDRCPVCGLQKEFHTYDQTTICEMARDCQEARAALAAMTARAEGLEHERDEYRVAGLEQQKAYRAAFAHAERAEAQSKSWHQLADEHWTHWQDSIDARDAALAEMAALKADLGIATACANLSGAQLLMIASEADGDPKIDAYDRRGSHWTPTLQAVAQLRADRDALRRDMEAKSQGANMMIEGLHDMQAKLAAADADRAELVEALAQFSQGWCPPCDGVTSTVYSLQADALRLLARAGRVRILFDDGATVRAEWCDTKEGE